VYDPWVLYRAGVLTNPNVLLVGVISTGKSALAKSLVVRSIAFGRVAHPNQHRTASVKIHSEELACAVPKRG